MEAEKLERNRVNWNDYDSEYKFLRLLKILKLLKLLRFLERDDRR